MNTASSMYNPESESDNIINRDRVSLNAAACGALPAMAVAKDKLGFSNAKSAAFGVVSAAAIYGVSRALMKGGRQFLSSVDSDRSVTP